MEMPLVGMERALPVDYPAEEGEGRIRQRHCERQQRNEEGYHGVQLEHAQYRRGRQDETEKLRADVAHEYLGRVEVIRDEAEARADKRGENHRDVRLRDEQRHDQHRQRAYRRHADGQPVQPVYQIDGVRAADDPQKGQRDGEIACENESGLLGKRVRVRYRVEDYAATDRNDGGDDLPRELDPRVEIDDIVYRAHDDDYQRAQQNAEHRRRHVDKYEQRQHKADEYGKSAHAGDRVVMHTALVLRDVYRADLFSKALDRRRHQERHNRRDDYGHQQLEPQ